MKMLKDNWPYLLMIFIYILVALLLHDAPVTKQFMDKKLVDMTAGELLWVGVVLLFVHRMIGK